MRCSSQFDHRHCVWCNCQPRIWSLFCFIIMSCSINYFWEKRWLVGWCVSRLGLMDFAVSLQVVPSIAIAFVTYEQVKELLGVEIRISDWCTESSNFHSFGVIFVRAKEEKNCRNPSFPREKLETFYPHSSAYMFCHGCFSSGLVQY